MRHRGEKLALRFVRRLGFGNAASILQRALFGGATLGQITRDLGEPDELTAGVTKRRDDDIRPEAGSVLPHAPAFVLDSSDANGSGDLVFGFSRLLVGRRIENREVLADDLVGQVALQTLCADVPCENVTCRVEHEDRIIADAFDEELVETSTFIGGLSRGLLVGHGRDLDSVGCAAAVRGTWYHGSV